MEALAHNSIADFVATAGTFLEADPVHYSVHLTTIDAVQRNEKRATALISLHANGSVAGAVTQLEAHSLHVAAMPVQAAEAVATLLRARAAKVDAISGPRNRVEALRKLWREGGTQTWSMRLYELESLQQPDVAGEPRTATAADDALITRWWTDFTTEAETASAGTPVERVREVRWIPAGHVLWLVDGKPVAWARTTIPVAGVSRVGPVYTPPQYRGNGYGAAVTAAISQWAYDAGATHVVLATDLNNPTSNAIYQRIGYRPVSDWSTYRWY